MKKTLIALAVAGLVAAPAAMAEVTVYGVAHISLDNIDSDNDAADTTLNVTSRASRIGVKAAEDLGNGLTAVAQMEWEVAMSGDNDVMDLNKATANNITARNQIIGIAGSFGTIAAGRHDTPYKMSTGSLDIFADTAADYNAIIGGPVGFERRATDALAYLSPDMAGFSVQAAIVAAPVDGDVPADGDDDTADATSIALQYKNGPLFAAIATETLADTAGAALDGGDAPTGVRAGVGYDAGVAKVGFVYENVSDVGAADDEYTAMLVNVAIPMGSNTIIAEYGVGELDDAGTDTTLMAVGVAHGFSKTTSAYVAYGNVSVDDTTDVDTNILTAGMVVKF